MQCGWYKAGLGKALGVARVATANPVLGQAGSADTSPIAFARRHRIHIRGGSRQLMSSHFDARPNTAVLEGGK